MTEEHYKSALQNAIQYRRESKQWNFEIASQVLKKKGIRRKAFAYSLSLAAAAIVVIGVTFGILNKPQPILYDQFISLYGDYGNTSLAVIVPVPHPKPLRH